MDKSVKHTMRGYVVGISLAAIAALLTGCGGGGGGGGSGSAAQAPTSTAPVAINSANQTKVAGLAVGAISLRSLSSTGSIVTGAAITGGGASSATPSLTQMALVALGLVDRIPQTVHAQVIHAATPTVLTFACLAPPSGPAGTETVTETLQTPGTFTTGDTLQITAQNCYLSTGSTVNGGFTLTIGATTGQPFATTKVPPYSVDLNIAMNAFSVTDSTGTQTANGTFDLLTNQTDAANSTDTLSVSANPIVLSNASLSATISAITLSVSQNSSTQAYSFTGSGTVATSDPTVNGSVSFATPTAFSGIGAGNPTAGSMTITGASSTTLTITANNDGQTVQLSLNGGPPTTTTWASLP